MKASKKDLDIVHHQYSKMLKVLVEKSVEYRDALLVIIREHDFKTEMDFKELGKDAFLYKIVDLYEFNKTETSEWMHDVIKGENVVMKEVNDILKLNP